MRILDTKIAAEKTKALALLNRRSKLQQEQQVELITRVAQIIEKVRQNGDQALCEYAALFDKVELNPGQLRVTEEEMRNAYQEVTESFIKAISQAKENITAFHQKQLNKDWLDVKADGNILGQRYLPVEAAGLYVPGGTGGTTPLVSSVLMNALPAVVAGVARLAICTPPNQSGGVNPYLLVTAAECGIKEIYKIGGAQAIAALAYGTESLNPVDVIVGPGNQYVTEAKRQVFGYVGLDMLAGPSEILIIAEKGNNPRFVAADLLSQAEHGPAGENGSFLLTDSPELAAAVAAEVARQLEELPRREVAAASLEKSSGIILVTNLTEAVKLANYSAPEHLELLVREPWSLMGQLKNAGAVFIGPYSTEPIGDYIAGPNHVLPTSGTARFASGLNVDHFLKKMNIIAYHQDGIRKYGQAAVEIAKVEGLDAHARSILYRLAEN